MRPDIINRVFHKRLQNFKAKLKKYGYMGRAVAEVHVIEFQKRGLPHAHILIWFAQEDKPHCSDDIAKLCTAEVPDPNLHPRLYQLVRNHMIHTPCDPNDPCYDPSKKHLLRCLNHEGKCSKGFPFKHNPTPTMPEDSYAQPRRITKEHGGFTYDWVVSRWEKDPKTGKMGWVKHTEKLDARWVVPYNGPMLLSVRSQSQRKMSENEEEDYPDYVSALLGSPPTTTTPQRPKKPPMRAAFYSEAAEELLRSATDEDDEKLEECPSDEEVLDNNINRTTPGNNTATTAPAPSKTVANLRLIMSNLLTTQLI